ncbi:MAG TPA: hypothetical protein VGA99_12560 [bacterium]
MADKNLLEMARKMIAGELPQPPVGALIGFRLAEIAAGHAVIEFEATGRHANPMGTLHGGQFAVSSWQWQ